MTEEQWSAIERRVENDTLTSGDAYELVKAMRGARSVLLNSRFNRDGQLIIDSSGALWLANWCGIDVAKRSRDLMREVMS